MIELGKRQTLTIIRKTDFGAYLKDTLDLSSDNTDEVLLPKKELPAELDVMDPIEVFIYRDSKDRLIATSRSPLIRLGQVGELLVKEVTGIGAFLDWGLEKDLLLPYKEMKGKPKAGDMVTVSLYVDKSNRLAATMWISDEKKKESSYEVNAEKLLGILKKNGRYLPLTDKSSPEDIRALTGFSKNEFKRAVGNLYKQRLLIMEEAGIRLK